MTWHDWYARRCEQRMLNRLARIPRNDMRIVISQLRRLPADCQTRILDGLPEWQQQALRTVLGRR